MPLVSEMIDQLRDTDTRQDFLVHSIVVSDLNSEDGDSEIDLGEVL